MFHVGISKYWILDGVISLKLITVSSANFAVSDYCPFGEIIPYTVSITLHFQLDMHETGLWYAILNRIIILRFSVACTQTIY